jgi:outer membrane protein assembly factor BamB
MHLNDEHQQLPPGVTKIYPVSLGGVESPVSFGHGKIFAPYIDHPMYLTPTGSDKSTPNPITEATGGLAAIDAATGEIVWDVKENSMVVNGAAVLNDVVLAGSLDGYLRAFDVKTGDKVWEFEAPAGLNAPIAIAGDTIVFAAAAPIIVATPANATPEATAAGATPAAARKPNPQIVALKLGS